VFRDGKWVDTVPININADFRSGEPRLDLHSTVPVSPDGGSVSGFPAPSNSLPPAEGAPIGRLALSAATDPPVLPYSSELLWRPVADLQEDNRILIPPVAKVITPPNPGILTPRAPESAYP
jgi:hypothetical protein